MQFKFILQILNIIIIYTLKNLWIFYNYIPKYYYKFKFLIIRNILQWDIFLNGGIRWKKWTFQNNLNRKENSKYKKFCIIFIIIYFTKNSKESNFSKSDKSELEDKWDLKPVEERIKIRWGINLDSKKI